MNCTSCRDRLSEFVRSELPPRAFVAVREHLAGCAACERLRDQTAATLSLLSRLGDPELPPDFAASLHRKLVSAPPPAPAGLLARARDRVTDLWFARPAAVAAGLSAALALSVVVFGVVFATVSHGRAGRPHEDAPAAIAAGEVAPIVVVPKTKIAVVRIDFVAEQDIEGVEFAIRLPEGLHFVSEGRELPDREFHWRGKLVRGSNPIPVAVRGARAGRYTLAAHAVGPDLDASQNVVLEVTSG